MEQTYYVYQHLNPKTKEVFYVGMGCQGRANDFKRGRNQIWKNYVSKYGEPIVEKVKENLTKKQASMLEKSLILNYGRKHLNEGNLTNISEGGEEGVKGRRYKMTTSHKFKISNSTTGKSKHTLESKAKISESHKGKSKPLGFGEKISEKLKGKNHSLEHRTNISKANKGREITWNLKGIPHPNISKHKIKAVNQLDTQGNFIKLWESMKSAAEYFSIHPNSIGACCQGKQKIAGGHKWQYKD
jgi:hypothetical protein